MQVHRAERAIVEAIARLTGLAPDHASMIRANRPVEAGFVQGTEYRVHVDITAIRWMRGLLKRMLASPLDVAAVREVDAWSDTFNDVDKIILGIDRERTGAEGNAVGTVVDEVDHLLQGRAVGNDSRQTENRPWRIIRVKCHRYVRAGCNGNDSLQKVRKVLPQPALVDQTVCVEQSAELAGGVSGCPAGQVRRSARQIDSLESSVIECQREGPIRQRARQIGAHPVEDGHEVIAENGHARAT